MNKTGNVWADLDFLERALELVNDEFVRAKFGKRIKQARFEFIEQIERGFIKGAITSEAFRNIMGFDADEKLILQSLEFHRNMARKPHKETIVFARQALNSFVPLQN